MKKKSAFDDWPYTNPKTSQKSVPNKTYKKIITLPVLVALQDIADT